MLSLEPPDTDAMPLAPTTRGQDARRYLEAHGFVAQHPYTRSSDDRYAGDEFLYYLCRRLGLYPAFRISTALSRGSWFHKALEHWSPATGVDEKPLRATLDIRVEELKAAGKALGVGGTTLAPYLEAEDQDYATALGWFKTAVDIPINREYGSLTQFFNRDHWELIGTETVIIRKADGRLGRPTVITLDSLWYHKTQKGLWIFDAKTCSEPAKERAQLCPIEFQTRHYIQTVQWALDSKLLHHHYTAIPADATLHGMIHWPVQKPTIVFGQKDRRYWYVSEGKRSGLKGTVNKAPGTEKWQASWEGTTGIHSSEDTAVEALHLYTGKKPNKVYAGEPSVDLYVSRCRDWYLGQGEYARDEAEKAAHVPVDLSFTPARYVLDAAETLEYDAQLRVIEDLATRPPDPGNFIRRTKGLRAFKKLSPYTPFYLSPIAKWPEIALRERFIVAPRDEDLPNESCVMP